MWRVKEEKHLLCVFPDCYMYFISHFPLPGAFFSFSLSLQSCQYQVPPWLSSLPLVTPCLFLPPGAQCLPRHVNQQARMYHIHFIKSCVMALWQEMADPSLDTSLTLQPGTLWQQVPCVNWAICKTLASFLFPVVIIFFGGFRWPLFL